MAEILRFKVESAATPATVLWKVPPGGPKNADVRDREHLMPSEVAALKEAAGSCWETTILLTGTRIEPTNPDDWKTKRGDREATPILCLKDLLTGGPRFPIG